MKIKEKEIYRELLVDKNEQAKMLVQMARGILGIDKESGDPIILVSRRNLVDRHLISLYLCGKFFSAELTFKPFLFDSIVGFQGNLLVHQLEIITAPEVLCFQFLLIVY